MFRLGFVAHIAAALLIYQPALAHPLDLYGYAMILSADEMLIDGGAGQIVVSGHVIAYAGGKQYIADKFIFDRKSRKIHASGNINIRSLKGSVETVDQLTLSDDFRDVFLAAFEVSSDGKSFKLKGTSFILNDFGEYRFALKRIETR